MTWVQGVMTWETSGQSWADGTAQQQGRGVGAATKEALTIGRRPLISFTPQPLHSSPWDRHCSGGSRGWQGEICSANTRSVGSRPDPAVGTHTADSPDLRHNPRASSSTLALLLACVVVVVPHSMHTRPCILVLCRRRTLPPGEGWLPEEPRGERNTPLACPPATIMAWDTSRGGGRGGSNERAAAGCSPSSGRKRLLPAASSAVPSGSDGGCPSAPAPRPPAAAGWAPVKGDAAMVKSVALPPAAAASCGGAGTATSAAAAQGAGKVNSACLICEQQGTDAQRSAREAGEREAMGWLLLRARCREHCIDLPT